MAVDENDSFIREVNEDIRQERLARLWKLLKPYIIGGALAIIVITIAAEVYSSYTNRKGQRLGDAFIQAHQLALSGADAAALAELVKIEKSGYGGYPLLAQFRAASLLASSGDKIAAVKAFDRITATGDFPQAWRDLAAVRAAYILADTGTAADVEQRVQPLDNDVNPMRFAAREALGLAYWKAGKLSQAAAYFNRNYSDKESQNFGFGERAAMMAALISSESSGAADEDKNEAPAVFKPVITPHFMKAPLKAQSGLAPVAGAPDAESKAGGESAPEPETGKQEQQKSAGSSGQAK